MCSKLVFARRQDSHSLAAFRVECKPDVAIIVVGRVLASAMMELKAHDGTNRVDMAKCVLMTSMSALSIMKSARKPRLKIYVQFLIGSMWSAQLFASCLDEDKKLKAVRIEPEKMKNYSEMVHLFATLAFMIEDVATTVASINNTKKLDEVEESWLTGDFKLRAIF